MKLFITSDIHGNKSIIDKLSIAYGESDADLLLVAGDIGGKAHNATTLKQLTKSQLQDFDYFINVLERCGKPFKFILGNDDWFDVDYKCCMKMGDQLDDIIAFDLVNITPFNTNREVNENKIAYELGKLPLSSDTIVLAHCPPSYKQDKIHSGEHVGSRSIRKCIDTLQPKLWICGHIHEDYGASNACGTLVLNCACDHLNDELRAFIVDTDTMQYSEINPVNDND